MKFIIDFCYNTDVRASEEITAHNPLAALAIVMEKCPDYRYWFEENFSGGGEFNENMTVKIKRIK